MFPGSILADRYELLERVAEGGMGEVWRAKQTALSREVAIKVLHPVHRVTSPDLEARFKREAELVGKVSHRNVIAVIDFGTTPKGDQFLVMPFLHGETLEARLKRDPPSFNELLEIMRDVLSGLAAIHDAGIVHRDLKPANVFLAKDSDGIVPKLLDLGISREENATGTMLTQDGTVMGTPQYMAPEQFESARTVDHRADIHSVGAMIYEATSGRPPYEGADAFAIFRAILEGPPPALESLRPELPPALVTLVHKAIAKAPDERFQSARAMRDALDVVAKGGSLEGLAVAVPEGDISTAPTALAPDSINELIAANPPKTTRVWPWVVGLVVLGAGGAAAAIAWPSEPARPTITEPVPIDTTAPPPEVEQAPAFQQVADSATLEGIALRWARLSPELRSKVDGFAEHEERWRMLASANVDVGALTRSLETEPLPLATTPTLRPRLLQSTARLHVHPAPDVDSADLRVIPHGTLVIALDGDIDVAGQTVRSPTEGESPMTYFVVAARSAGWAATRFLELSASCLPLPASLIRGVPSGRRPAVRRTVTVSRTEARVDGANRDVLLFAGHDGDTSYFALHRALSGCRPGAEISDRNIEGKLEEYFLTDRNGDGETLLIASTEHPTDDRGVRRWGAYALGEEAPDAPLWSAELPTGLNLEDDSGAVNGTRDLIMRRCPGAAVLVIRHPGVNERDWLGWDGEGFEAISEPAACRGRRR